MISVRCLFTHCPSLPKFCYHQAVFSITICCPERSDIKYTWMRSPIFQIVVNLFMRCPSKFMNVSMWERCTFVSQILDVTKFTTLIPLSILILCKLSFPSVGLKMFSLPTLALNSPNKNVYGVYRIHILVPRRSPPPYHQFYPLLGHEHSERWYHTSDLSVLCTSYR
jgi:hypothetical protein